MKTLICLIALVIAAVARAGMPDVEMREALVEGVEKTPAGWVAILTGPATVPMMNGPRDSSLATLYLEKARISVPFGNYFYALSSETAYEARLKAMVGRKVEVQMWGATIIVQAGRVVQIIAGDVSLLRPEKKEAAFDLERLKDIATK